MRFSTFLCLFCVLPPFIDAGLLIGHRGAMHEAPENTMSAMKRAVEIGVDWIEFDVHLTKDQHLVVIHDEHVSRTTDGKENLDVTEMTLEEVKALDAGSKFSQDFAGEQVPTLDEVLEMPRRTTGLMIEVKPSKQNPRDIARAVVTRLRALRPEKTIVGTKSLEIMKYLRLYLPQVPAVGIVHEPEEIEPFLDLGASRIVADKSIVTPKITKQLHEQGIPLWTWEENHPVQAQAFLDMGVEGIISAHPALLKKSAEVRL